MDEKLSPQTEVDLHPATNRQSLSLGQRAADVVTKHLGSWGCIIFIVSYMAVWIGLDVFGWQAHWDPFPFILLNLTLSCIAALQAPIILMSQNRQAERDRLTAKYDYAVNRKAEREIRQLQEDIKAIRALLEEKKQK